MKINHFILITALSAIISLTALSPAFGFDTAPRISDREIVERLTRLEEGQKAILREIDKRFESIDKRFESIDNRFDSIDKRFESIDKRFEEFQNLVIGILASFAGIVAVTIGFAIWDRRTALKPVESKLNRFTGDLATHDKKLSDLFEVLKQKAKTDHDLAAILRSFSIL